MKTFSWVLVAIFLSILSSGCSDSVENANRQLCDEKAPKFGTAVYIQKKMRAGAGESDFVTTNPETPGIFLRFYETLHKGTDINADVVLVQRRAQALCYEHFGIIP